MIVLPLQCNDLDYVKATVTTKVTAKAIPSADTVDTASGASRDRVGRTQPWRKEKSLLMILNELKARRGEKRSLLLILRPTFLWEII